MTVTERDARMEPTVRFRPPFKVVEGWMVGDGNAHIEDQDGFILTPPIHAPIARKIAAFHNEHPDVARVPTDQGSPRGQEQVGERERRCIMPAKFDDRRQFNHGRAARGDNPIGNNERSYKERRRRTTPPPAPGPEGAPRTVGPCPFLLPVSARYDKDHEEWDLVDADNDRLFSIKSWDGGEAIVQYIAAALNSYGRTVEDE